MKFDIKSSQIILKRTNKEIHLTTFKLTKLKSIGLPDFEVFTAVTKKNAVFWDVAPCRYCINRRFGGMYRLHLCKLSLQPPAHAGSSLVDILFFLLPWRWRCYVPPKRWFIQYLHGPTYWLATLIIWIVNSALIQHEGKKGIPYRRPFLCSCLDNVPSSTFVVVDGDITSPTTLVLMICLGTQVA
jgi:hypothetical protein